MPVTIGLVGLRDFWHKCCHMTDMHLVWFHRILRWGLGLLFIGVGLYYWQDDAWPAVLFGAVMLATGFLRPKRCIEDRECHVDRH